MSRLPALALGLSVPGVMAAPGCVAPSDGPAIVEGAGGRWELLAPITSGPQQESAVVALAGDVLIASDAGAPEVFVIGGADGDGFTDVVSV